MVRASRSPIARASASASTGVADLGSGAASTIATPTRTVAAITLKAAPHPQNSAM